MRKLLLEHDDFIQGSFELGKLNLLFVFQVNCPGCFLYGIPVINGIFLENKDKGLNVLGLSTAFEDFEFNTAEFTKRLLEEKTMVGETAKAFKQQGLKTYPNPIDFPVAFDKMVDPSEFITERNVEHICNFNPNFKSRDESDQKRMRKLVKEHFMQMPKIAVTFTMNQLRGTPSCILFDKNFHIKEQWFGHENFNEINKIIEKWMSG